MSPSEINQILQEMNIGSDAARNDSLSEPVFALLQLIERLNQENEKLKIEIQKLRDEINLLKGRASKTTKKRILFKFRGEQKKRPR